MGGVFPKRVKNRETQQASLVTIAAHSPNLRVRITENGAVIEEIMMQNGETVVRNVEGREISVRNK